MKDLDKPARADGPLEVAASRWATHQPLLREDLGTATIVALYPFWLTLSKVIVQSPITTDVPLLTDFFSVPNAIEIESSVKSLMTRRALTLSAPSVMTWVGAPDTTTVQVPLEHLLDWDLDWRVDGGV
ncbi:hypothetical protein AB0B45_40210 [Nonomuraea sp. NPDC049152]|uniref:hypothetical protein n=1 Tax=Nonomuraea sp. NPDC049152 TaxID=3154350 RepID=UPI0033DD16CE